MKIEKGAHFASAALVAVGLLFCAACASKNEVARADETPSTTPMVEDPQWWAESLFSTQREHFDAIREICRPLGYPAHETCVREQMVTSLGVGTEASAHCNNEANTALFLACIDRGSSAEWTLVALGSKSEMDWSNTAQSLGRAGSLLAGRLQSKCGYSRRNDCVAREMAYLFGLDSNEADRCAGSGDIHIQVRCAMALSLLEKYRRALLFVG